jgi:short-subunit dehydrogenase
MKSNHIFAVLTGASQGYGKAIAFELARRRINLILVALPGEGLDKLADELKRYEIEVLYYEVNLVIKEDLLKFTKWINDNYQVNILINNAGIGGTKHILDSNVDYIDNIIQLNITATSLITHQLLPNLLSQKEKSYILNVSSMASFSPIAYKTVYPASKRFIHDFSRGLSQELKDSNVFVSVVHPGPMKTNADVTKRITRQGILGKVGLLTPQKAAYLTIRQLFKMDGSILPGWFNTVNWILMSILPDWIKIPLISRPFRKQTTF